MAGAAADVNPGDAAELGIGERDMIKVTSRRGQVKIRARLTGSVPRGTIFIPFNFQESAANALTNSERDPVSKIPEFKVCAVKVEKAASRR
jgi:anaerobic selenocysteine-containing dehydrogenase